jgi:rhodanese-related sulfurtransferase
MHDTASTATTAQSAPASVDAGSLATELARGEQVTLLDVRTPGEFEAGHIPGSYNVPLDLLDEHRAELRRVTHPVVLVCRSGSRAAQAERKLAEVGMSQVKVLTGGISAWQASGGQVRQVRERWDLERQVRMVAGGLVLTSILASVAFPPAKWLAGAVGAGLTVAALTNTCTMGLLLSKLPYNRAAACDVSAVVARLAETERPG